MRQLALIALALALAACGSEEPAPGIVTTGEARALDDAMQMIEAGRPPDASSPAAAPSATPSAVATPQ